MTWRIILCGISLATLIVNIYLMFNALSTAIRTTAMVGVFFGSILFIAWLVRIAFDLHQQFLSH